MRPSMSARVFSLVVLVGCAANARPSAAAPSAWLVASAIQGRALDGRPVQATSPGVAQGSHLYADDGDVTWRVLGTSAAVLGTTGFFTLAGAAVGAGAAYGYFACVDTGCLPGEPLGLSSEGPFEPVFIATGGVLGGIGLGALGLFLSAGLATVSNLESYDEP